MTMHTLPMPATSALGRIFGFAGTAAVRVIAFVRAYKHRRDLQLLAGFDDRMLRDIGLTRGDLRDAVAEPLWRDPTNVLVMRAGDRRHGARGMRGAASFEVLHVTPKTVTAPPLAPETDTFSSSQFPARSRYY
jgi:uncharacterized protein YjiS (DUF1127 family)